MSVHITYTCAVEGCTTPSVWYDAFVWNLGNQGVREWCPSGWGRVSLDEPDGIKVVLVCERHTGRVKSALHELTRADYPVLRDDR